MDDLATDLVTVASYADVAEAELARERLELEGIAAFVLGAQTAGVMPYLMGVTGGVRVQVKPKDVEQAKEILGV
ncbi:MAG: putative signal transducing protein [Polyangiaceae bacterium]